MLADGIIVGLAYAIGWREKPIETAKQFAIEFQPALR